MMPETPAAFRRPLSGRHRTHRRRFKFVQPQMSLTDAQLLAARSGVYILCFFDNAQHYFGVLMYASVIVLSILCLSRDSMALFRLFIPLWLVSIIYILLSLAHVLPAAWTVFYEISAMPSQVNWLLALPLIASLANAYASHVLRIYCLREFTIVSILLVFNFIASGFLSSDHYSIFSYGPWGYLWAPISIYLVVVVWGVCIQNNTTILVLFLMQTVPAILLAAGSQTKIAYATVAGALVLRRVHSSISGLALVCVIAFVVGGYTYTLSNVYEVYQDSSDVGIRALMARNAFIAFLDSKFIGVGFGTESLLNEYPEVGLRSFAWMDDAFVLIGVHNSFVDVLMRMGVLGVGALLFAILQLASPFGGRFNPALDFRRIMLAIVVLNMSVNVALQSPFHMAGISMMLGAAFAVRGNSSGLRTI